MKKEALSVLLIFALIMSLAACAKSGTSSTVAASSSSVSEAASTVSSTPEKKVEKFTYATNNMCDSELYRNKWCELFKKDTGITMEIIALPKEDYEDKLMALMMSNDLPDIIDAPTDITSLISQEKVIDINPYLKQNTALQAVINKNPECIGRYTIDNSVYAVASSLFQTMGIWVRDDINKVLGISDPTTLDEFTSMLRKYKEAYPDNVPLTTVSGIHPHDAIANYFGVMNEISKKNGKYVDYTTTSDYKEYLDYMKALYTEKLLDQETPTNSSYGAVRTKFRSGQALSLLMWDNNYAGHVSALEKSGFKDTNPHMITPFKGTKGVFGVMYDQPEGPLCVTSAAKEYAKQIVDVFYQWQFTTDDGIISTSVGIEGVNYDVVNGVCVFKSDVTTGHLGQSYPPIKLDYSYPFKFDDATTKNTQVAVDMRKLSLKYESDVVLVPVPTKFSDYTAVQTDLDAKRAELYYNYITGQITYDSFLSQYNAYTKSIGLEDMLKKINA